MMETVIGIACSIASAVLRIISKEKKYRILSAVLGLIGSIAFLIAVCRKNSDDEEIFIEE